MLCQLGNEANWIIQQGTNKLDTQLFLKMFPTVQQTIMIHLLEPFCSFTIHMEGKQSGVEWKLKNFLTQYIQLPGFEPSK